MSVIITSVEWIPITIYIVGDRITMVKFIQTMMMMEMIKCSIAMIFIIPYICMIMTKMDIRHVMEIEMIMTKLLFQSMPMAMGL